MTRILATLGTLSLVVMVVAFCLGHLIGNLYVQPSEQTLRIATAHRLTGTAAALAVVLVHSIVVTYFIGTSRWCREVVETYRLDPHLAEASQAAKRRAFPWAVAGMLAVIGVAALGAASDPATGRPDADQWTPIHLIAALAGIAFVAWTYYAAWCQVVANQAVVDRIAGEVARIRAEKGLDS